MITQASFGPSCPQITTQTPNRIHQGVNPLLESTDYSRAFLDPVLPSPILRRYLLQESQPVDQGLSKFPTALPLVSSAPGFPYP